MKKTFAQSLIALKKGYSLVELLIVAGLLVLLSTAALPQIYNAFSKVGGAKAADVTAEVVSAKARSVVDAGGNSAWDSANTTETARFTSIAPYLAVAGVQPTNAAAMVAGLGTSATLTVHASTVAPAITGTSF